MSMSREQHVTRAEQLMLHAKDRERTGDSWSVANLLSRAQVHATLALSAKPEADS